MINKLLELKSYNAIEDVVNNITLKDGQCVDVLKMLYRKKSILNYDTGMGKTCLACACIRLLLNEDSTRHFIFLGTNRQLAQTPRELKEYLGMDIAICSGDAKSISINLLSENYKKYSVLFITHEVLLSQVAVRHLAANINFFNCVIIDEAHRLNNNTSSLGANVLAAMCKNMEYAFALTATPITTSAAQLIRLVSMLDPVTYPNPNKLLNNINKGRFSFPLDDPCMLIAKTRNDFGVQQKISGQVLLVPAMEHQKNVRQCDVVRTCKGPGAINQAEALVAFIKERKGQRGLIYINEHATRNWVLPFLDNAGIAYACINGHVSNAETADIQYDFNHSDKYQVLILSVTESLSLDCDWVLFYEFTVKVQQMLGRAYRGFASKELPVTFMITQDTNEPETFLRNIYSRAVFIQRLLGREYTAVIEAANELT